MDGFSTQHIRGLGNEPHVLWGSFQCNGTSTPASTSFRYPSGLNFTVAYSATGVFTVTLPAGFTLPAQPASIQVTPEFASVATAFEVGVLGESTLNTTTRQFVIQAKQGTTGFAPTNAAGNRIHFAIFFNNSTGA